jgi:hypothetical protein
MKVVFTFILYLITFILQPPEEICIKAAEEFPDQEYYLASGIRSVKTDFVESAQIWPGNRNALEAPPSYLNGDGYKDLIFRITVIADLLIMILMWILMLLYLRKDYTCGTE